MKTTTTTAPAKKYNLPEIKAANKAAGQHFFERGATRFFNSSYLPTVYSGPGGYYFITGEQFDHRSPVAYTVRSFDPATGEVDTAGEFNKCERAEARANAKQYAQHGI